MASKEEKDKKSKKKKSAKPSEDKGKDASEEQVEKGEAMKEEPEAGKPDALVPEPPPVVEEEKENLEAEPPKEEQPIAPEKPRPAEKIPETKKNEKEESKTVTAMDLEKLVELKEAFSLFDFNHDGIIDLQDLKYTFASLGKPDFPEEEMQRMLNEATEPVDFDAFAELFGFKVSVMMDPEEVFTGALSTWDMRNVGVIPEERLKRDIRCFGDKFNDKETENALEEASVFVNDGVPVIDYVKFGNSICGFRKMKETRKYQKELEEKEARRYD